jgi:hypothetical protein
MFRVTINGQLHEFKEDCTILEARPAVQLDSSDHRKYRRGGVMVTAVYYLVYRHHAGN